MNQVRREYIKKINKSKTETCKIKNFYNIRAFSDSKSNLFSFFITMAKGKTTYQAGRSESGLQHYVYAVQKKNLPAGEKLTLMKYDKKLRKHVLHTFKDVK